MKLHSIGQDFQNSFGLVKQYLVHPVDPVKKRNSGAIKFPLRSNWPHFTQAAVLDSDLWIHLRTDSGKAC
jgi:hypothetical protein